MSAPAQSIELSPDKLFARNDRQIEAWKQSLRHRFLLYGGAAGGGKSFFLRWWCVFYLMVLFKFFQVRKAQVILACEDYPTLKDRQISRIQAEFPKSLGNLCLGETRDFTLADKYGGGRILLRNLDDPSKYLSSEFAGVAVEELTRNQEQTFHDLRLRMRWPGVQRPGFAGATNPGGKGHAWVKKYWIDRKFPAEMQALAKEFFFVQAKAADNPFLTQNYYEDLKTLPGPMQSAYLEGRWDLFVGQYFDVFTAARHVAKWRGDELVCPRTGSTYRINHSRVGDKWFAENWPKWVSLDWGFKDPSVVHWHATAPDGKHITYREWAVDGVTPRMLAEGIVERSVDSERRAERIQQFFISPDAFADREGQSTIAEQLRDVACRGNRFPSPAAASDDRVGGWMLLYQLLQGDEWLIAENCETLISSLPTLVRDEKNVEDCADSSVDHAPDSARYGMYSRFGPVRQSAEVRAAKAVEHVKDPTERAIVLEKFHEQERKKNQPVPLGSRHGGGRRWRPGQGGK
jgi:phage terminase large subunit